MRHLRPVRSFLVAQLLVIVLVCALQHVNAQINNVGQKATTGTDTPAMPSVIQSQELEDMPGVIADLIQATRSDDVLTIKVRFRNTSDKQVYLNLTRGGRCDAYYVTAGTKRYTVLKDGPSVYLMAVKSFCNETAPGIAPGQTFTFWGKFQAPPATVKKIDFFTPIMPPFEGIPISDSSTGATSATNTGTSNGTLPPNWSTSSTCAPGYYGQYCVPCPGNPPNACSSPHGQCKDGTQGTGECVCNSGYSGAYCQNGP